MNELNQIVEQWLEDHKQTLTSVPNFKSITIKTNDLKNKAVAKVNIKTGEMEIYKPAFVKMADSFKLPAFLLCYYVLSHEYGHLLYEGDPGMKEEYLVHDFAIKDCLKKLSLKFNKSYFKRLDAIRLLLAIHESDTNKCKCTW